DAPRAAGGHRGPGVGLVAEAGMKRGFGISVTEDAPVAALEKSLAVIARVLQDY
ncbi:MAG: hypothetical protein H6Q87_534, partial [candidate division NC10 bacterium]|nr:hypothetical protein [candidate division NC10 bacterium]